MAKDGALPTDFDDDEIDTSPAVATDQSSKSVGKDEDGIPYCAKHHCRMKQTSGGKKGSNVAYYACPVGGCEEKAKRVKQSRSVIPAEPHACPRCRDASPRPVLERDLRLSTGFYTILKCPRCGHKSGAMPRPEFVAYHARSRGKVPAEDLGAR